METEKWRRRRWGWVPNESSRTMPATIKLLPTSTTFLLRAPFLYGNRLITHTPLGILIQTTYAHRTIAGLKNKNKKTFQTSKIDNEKAEKPWPEHKVVFWWGPQPAASPTMAYGPWFPPSQSFNLFCFPCRQHLNQTLRVCLHKCQLHKLGCRGKVC